MRSLIVAAAMALAFASAAGAVPNCKTGQLCGNACIAKGLVCHKPNAAPATPPKHCKDPKTKKFESCSKPGAIPA